MRGRHVVLAGTAALILACVCAVVMRQEEGGAAVSGVELESVGPCPQAFVT